MATVPLILAADTWTQVTDGTKPAFIQLQTFGVPILIQVAASLPANVSVASTGIYTLTNIPIADDTFTINGQVYTWKAAPSAAFEVDIGASAAISIVNMVAAINLTGTEGVEYGAGTTLNADVTGVDGAGDTIDLTAKVAGTVGDAITIAESGINSTVSGANLTGGVDESRVGIRLLTSGDWMDSHDFPVAQLAGDEIYARAHTKAARLVIHETG